MTTPWSAERERKVGAELSRRNAAIVVAAIGLLFVSCGGASFSPSVATVGPETTATATSVASPTLAVAPGPCQAAQLTVGDLPDIDQKWQAGISAATTAAHAWQADAFLTALEVSCQLFESDFRWQATFYSKTAQAYYLSDTTEVIPAGVDPDSVPSLQGITFQFGAVYRALIKSGYSDADGISPSTGVDIGFNTDLSPFGPSSEPKNTVIYHVAILRLGETKDVFVDGSNGSIYRYPG